MPTRNEVTKKLKTGQRVTLPESPRWAVLFDYGSCELFMQRSAARIFARQFSSFPGRIVRLNPITGVVSK